MKNPNRPTEGISDTPSLLKIIKRKFPKQYMLDDEPIYIIRLSGVEVDVLMEVIEAYEAEGR